MGEGGILGLSLDRNVYVIYTTHPQRRNGLSDDIGKKIKCKTMGLIWEGNLCFWKMCRQVRPPKPDSGTLKMDTKCSIEAKGTKPYYTVWSPSPCEQQPPLKVQTKSLQTFYGKGPHRWLWAGSQAVSGKSNNKCTAHRITIVKFLWHIHNLQMRPRFRDPWRRTIHNYATLCTVTPTQYYQ